MSKYCYQQVAYALQGLLKEEMERLQRQQIIVPPGWMRHPKWCNSFIMVPEVNGKVNLCLDLARLDKGLIRPMHKGLTLNNILPRLAGMKSLTLIDIIN